MDDLLTLERRIQEFYETALYPLSEKAACDLPKRWKGAAGSPSVLFLGNHSSGKSSFINFLLGAPLQKSGLAPTDDGFTIITFGEKQDEFDGQTVVTHRDLAYADLQRLGPPFLSRLRLKTFPHDLLRSVTLIDSPGMIDAGGKPNTRGYDFAASVRHFAEQADLILFFFDPDKPGTTGETVSIFTETLTGLEYKLLIILNKVDLFSNIRDFARTYGTLSWNLAKNIGTKDIPHIFNIYVPGQEGKRSPENAIRLSDFDVSRDEVIHQIKRTPTRRADNLVSTLHQDVRRLEMHTRVLLAAAARYRAARRKWIAIIGLELLFTGLFAWFFWDSFEWQTRWLTIFIGLAIAAGLTVAARFALAKSKRRLLEPGTLDETFHTAFHRELALQDRADLRALWESVRHQVAVAIEVIQPGRIPSMSLKRMLKKVQEIGEKQVPRLRRDISEYHRERGMEPPSTETPVAAPQSASPETVPDTALPREGNPARS